MWIDNLEKVKFRFFNVNVYKVQIFCIHFFYLCGIMKKRRKSVKQDKYFIKENSEELINMILSDDFKLEEKVHKMDKILYSGEFKWAFFCADLSKKDLSSVALKKLMRLPFGNYTIWPSKDKLPSGFEPQKVFKEALTFKGCEVEQTHLKGIKGRNTTIAFIDMPFNYNHVELSDANIEYVELEKCCYSHFHGLVTSSYLVGKNLGVAPESKLLFYAANGIGQSKNEIENIIENEFKAIEDIIARSKNGQKIDIIGQSSSIKHHITFVQDEEKKKTYLDKYEKLIFELEKEKIFYLSSENFFDMFTYCKKIDPTKNNYDYDNYINAFNFIDNNEKIKPSVIPVGKLSPIDDTQDAYKYENLSGSASWSIPLIVGMFALARQLKPNISFKEFYNIVCNTVKENQNGLPIISAVNFCKEIIQRDKIKTIEGSL